MRLHPAIARTSFLLCLAAASVSVAAGQRGAADGLVGLPSTVESIWRDPGPVATLDLINGGGDTAHVPSPAGRFTFVGEEDSATSPKFDVTDAHGVIWKVKLGDESRAETAATRFLWAAGY